MGKFGIGQPVPRTEDPRFLTGQGRYTDDISLPGEVHGTVLRSPHAHGDIKSVDVKAAKAAPGVLAVLTGADYVAEGLGALAVKIMPMPLLANPPTMSTMPAVQAERVRYVGEPVAFVVAETLEQAKDAAELIEIDYVLLPAVPAPGRGAAGGNPNLGRRPGKRVLQYRDGRYGSGRKGAWRLRPCQ